MIVEKQNKSPFDFSPHFSCENANKARKEPASLPLTGSFFVAFFLYKAKNKFRSKGHDERREN